MDGNISARLALALTAPSAEQRAAQAGTLAGLAGRRQQPPATEYDAYMRGWLAGHMARESSECGCCHRRLYLLHDYCDSCLEAAFAWAS